MYNSPQIEKLYDELRDYLSRERKIILLLDYVQGCMGDEAVLTFEWNTLADEYIMLSKKIKKVEEEIQLMKVKKFSDLMYAESRQIGSIKLGGKGDD